MAQTPEVVEGYHHQVWPGQNVRQLLEDGFEEHLGNQGRLFAVLRLRYLENVERLFFVRRSVASNKLAHRDADGQAGQPSVAGTDLLKREGGVGGNEGGDWRARLDFGLLAMHEHREHPGDGDQRSRAGRFRLPRPAFRAPERHGGTAYLQTVQLEGQQAGNASWAWVVDERDGAVSKRPFRNDEGVTLFDVLSDAQRDGISDLSRLR